MAESLEEHVTCAICMDLYDDPLALPCMHSFCRRCLQGIIASSLSLKCPECRKDIKLGKKGIDGLPRNFQLGCIVSSYQRDMNTTQELQSNSRLPFCTVHRLPCPLQCKKCRDPVCLKCVTEEQHATHPLSVTDDTNEIMDVDIDVYCEKHSRQFKLYCRTCQSLVCLNCVTTRDHAKHIYSAIDNAYEQRRLLLESRLREFEKQQQITRSNWKTFRDFAQKTQTDAQRKRDQLTKYFNRLKDTLEKREKELKLELDNRETRVISDCKRKIDALQTSDKKISNNIDQIKQLLTEERLQLLNSNVMGFDRELMSLNEIPSTPSQNLLEDVSLVTCQFEKEVKNIQWEWPKQVLERAQGIEPTAPPGDNMRPIPRARRRSSQRTDQLNATQGYQQQQQQQQYQQRYQRYQQSQEPNTGLAIGSLVQRGKHWKSGMEDGGPGHLGTVTQTTLDPHAYVVRWPNGKTGSYTYNPLLREEIIPP